MNSRVLARLYSSTTSGKKCSKTIRKEFLDYFTKDLNHTIIRSSPVAPINDSSISFVNAGMNQFKGIFLEYYTPPATKVVNSQKCIRISGKHNDLDLVGRDTYHHTFFEMLGNWSFGDYFKEEACLYAWNLLTRVYGIKKELLYVTYFGGDEELGLKPDLECRDIWLRLGVPQNKILPCGMKDNFWEMGLSGPCGPCTEIHIDQTMKSNSQFKNLNKNNRNLTELWNIVFIQYERLATGSIVPLPKHHVDTGLGFERLVALLQEKDSNYDTDLFSPLFETIQKCSKAPEYKGEFDNSDKNKIDYAYRVLADHSRMITVAIADGVFPEENQKLRRILRKSIDICENVFKKDNLLSELSCTVAEIFEETYPELQKNLKKVQTIIRFEQELFERLKKSCGKEWKKITQTRPELSLITDWTAPGLIAGYKDLQSMLKKKQTSKYMPGEIAFRLYDTYGLNPTTIAELAEVECLEFNEDALNKELNNAKHRSRVGIQRFGETLYFTSIEKLEKDCIPKTDDSFKYKYTFEGNNYKFPKTESKIVGLLINGNLTDSICTDNSQNTENEIGIVLDRTACYSPEGGQLTDKGHICVKDLVFNVNTIRKIKNYVIHFGNFASTNIVNSNVKWSVGDKCTVSIDSEIRIGAMRNHTAIHLLNAAMNQVMQVIYQRGSSVKADNLRYQFNSFGEQLTLKSMKTIEDLINSTIKANVPVTTKVVNVLQLLAEDDITLLPDETYPHDEIRILEINGGNIKSKEPCCGTHVYNTGHLLDFCILNYASKGTINRRITAAAGPLATLAKRTCENIRSKIIQLGDDFRTGNITYDILNDRINEIKFELNDTDGKTVLPYIAKQDCLDHLETLKDSVLEQQKQMEKTSVLNEITGTVDTALPFIVHRIQQQTTVLSLHEILSVCPNIPILLISLTDKNLKLRCSVPQEIATDEFNAQTWMRIASKIFDVKEQSIKGFNPLLVARLHLKCVPQGSFESLIEKVIEETTQFASRHQETMKIVSKVK